MWWLPRVYGHIDRVTGHQCASRCCGSTTAGVLELFSPWIVAFKRVDKIVTFKHVDTAWLLFLKLNLDPGVDYLRGNQVVLLPQFSLWSFLNSSVVHLHLLLSQCSACFTGVQFASELWIWALARDQAHRHTERHWHEDECRGHCDAEHRKLVLDFVFCLLWISEIICCDSSHIVIFIIFRCNQRLIKLINNVLILWLAFIFKWSVLLWRHFFCFLNYFVDIALLIDVNCTLKLLSWALLIAPCKLWR